MFDDPSVGAVTFSSGLCVFFFYALGLFIHFLVFFYASGLFISYFPNPSPHLPTASACSVERDGLRRAIQAVAPVSCARQRSREKEEGGGEGYKREEVSSDLFLICFSDDLLQTSPLASGAVRNYDEVDVRFFLDFQYIYIYFEAEGGNWR